MSIPRALWWALAVAALGFAAWVGTWPIADISLSCSKTGELHLDDGRSWLSCDTSIVQVLGVRPLIWLGLLLVVPPVVAVLAMRTWVSWSAVAALAGLSIVGLANWSSHWMVLLFAAPMAALGLIPATSQQVAPRRGEPAV